MKPLVYIAGPYSHPDPVANTRRAIHHGMHIRDGCGVDVIIPHLSLLAHMLNPQSTDYWYRYGLDLVEHCHGLYRLTGDSIGADLEVDLATKAGLNIYFETNGADVGHLKDWARTWHP